MAKTPAKTEHSETNWMPNPQQAAVLDAARYGMHRSIKAICTAANVPRGTYYRWLADDAQFADAWANLWRGSAQGAMPLVLAAMVREAVKGNVAAARLVSEIAEATRTQDLAIFNDVKFDVTFVAANLEGVALED